MQCAYLLWFHHDRFSSAQTRRECNVTSGEVQELFNKMFILSYFVCLFV